MDREHWSRAVADLVGGIDYGNFKNAVVDVEGPFRHHLYQHVWTTMSRLE